MVDILNMCRMLFKRRQHKRYVVQSSTFVLVSPNTVGERKVQVVDISMGGAAFIYNGRPEDLEESGVLKLLAEDVAVEKVSYETVFDVPASERAKPSETFRRRGVKFKWMGVLDGAELRKFIKKVTSFTT